MASPRWSQNSGQRPALDSPIRSLPLSTRSRALRRLYAWAADRFRVIAGAGWSGRTPRVDRVPPRLPSPWPVLSRLSIGRVCGPRSVVVMWVMTDGVVERWRRGRPWRAARLGYVIVAVGLIIADIVYN